MPTRQKSFDNIFSIPDVDPHPSLTPPASYSSQPPLPSPSFDPVSTEQLSQCLPHRNLPVPRPPNPNQPPPQAARIFSRMFSSVGLPVLSVRHVYSPYTPSKHVSTSILAVTIPCFTALAKLFNMTVCAVSTRVFLRRSLVSFRKRPLNFPSMIISTHPSPDPMALSLFQTRCSREQAPVFVKLSPPIPWRCS